MARLREPHHTALHKFSPPRRERGRAAQRPQIPERDHVVVEPQTPIRVQQPVPGHVRLMPWVNGQVRQVGHLDRHP